MWSSQTSPNTNCMSLLPCHMLTNKLWLCTFVLKKNLSYLSRPISIKKYENQPCKSSIIRRNNFSLTRNHYMNLSMYTTSSTKQSSIRRLTPTSWLLFKCRLLLLKHELWASWLWYYTIDFPITVLVNVASRNTNVSDKIDDDGDIVVEWICERKCEKFYEIKC